MISTLEKLIGQQRLDHFDRYFVRLLQQLDNDAGPMVLLACAFARKAVSAGHVCVELSSLAGTPIIVEEKGDQEEVECWPSFSILEQALCQSCLVGDGKAITPLVYD
jgi:hypothetical protein